MMETQPAVFLDRDGVINKERGYVHLIEDFHFIDGVFEACREMSRAGYRLIIITNQAGIARGYYTEEVFQCLTNWMLNEFRQQDIDIDGVYYCPHHPVYGVGEYHRDCNCRKPSPGMIHLAAKEHSLDLGSSILVGDKATDIEAGRAAGLGCCVLVQTGHSLRDEDLEKADAVFSDLLGVARALTSDRLCTGCRR
jgi:D-glycero-D-manno-heptose 1,7-bisphosphate phosphatase